MHLGLGKDAGIKSAEFTYSYAEDCHPHSSSDNKITLSEGTQSAGVYLDPKATARLETVELTEGYGAYELVRTSGTCEVSGNTVTMEDADCSVEVRGIKKKYKVTGSVSPDEAASIYGTDKLPITKEVEHGNSATLTAPTLEGWTFNGWSVIKGGENCSTESSDLSSAELNIRKVEGDCGFNAGYTKNEPDVKKIKVTFAAFGGKGTVSNPGSELEVGYTTMSMAKPNNGYKFKEWTKQGDGACEITKGSLTTQTIEVKAVGTKDCTYLAYFEEATTSKTTVEFWVTNSVGTLTVDGTKTNGTTEHKSKTITTGSQVNVSAAEADGASFLKIQVMSGSCLFSNGTDTTTNKQDKLTVSGEKCQVMAYINPTGGTTGYSFNLCVAQKDYVASVYYNKSNPTNSSVLEMTTKAGQGGRYYNDSEYCTSISIPAESTHIFILNTGSNSTGQALSDTFAPYITLNGRQLTNTLMSRGCYIAGSTIDAGHYCASQNPRPDANFHEFYSLGVSNGDKVLIKRFAQN